MKRAFGRSSLVLFISLVPVGLAQGQIALDVNPALPSDIAGGAPAATLQQAAAFAWQEFIALNWPAKAGDRDKPDPNQKFGTGSGPLVWETFRSKVEIFNLIKDAAGNDIPPGYSDTPPDYGYYSLPPAYFYRTKPVPACPGQAEPASPAWVNIDETTQISLDQMFAGGPPIEEHPTGNTSPQLIRFAVKANHVEYDYVAEKQYFLPDNVTQPAMNNYTAYAKTRPPVAPTPPFISFKPGTVEIKSAWRPLNNYDNPARFHVQTVRFYEDKGPGNAPCYFEQKWGLIALHIIQKTPSAPAFIYATFEQADNIRQLNATPVEDPDGNVINPPSDATPTTPALAYDPTVPKVTVTPVGAPFCTPQNNLYFKDNPKYTNLTGGAAVCVNKRYEPIPPDVIAVNLAAHVAITGYDTANGIESSPWLYYKLVSVQASPFDVSAISPTDPIHGPSVFFQANIVVETNYTLQQFQGRMVDGVPSAVPAPQVPPPNVVTPAPTPDAPNGVVGVNMGGCMGCHGNAQVTAGTDFSFILAEGPTPSPETPSAISDPAVRAKYLNLFYH